MKRFTGSLSVGTGANGTCMPVWANLRGSDTRQAVGAVSGFSSRVAQWFRRVTETLIFPGCPEAQAGGRDSRFDASNRYRVIAAPGEFRSILSLPANVRDSVKRIERSTPRRSATVAGAWKFNASAMLERVPHCGLRWDQDFNAAKNILERNLDEDVLSARGVAAV